MKLLQLILFSIIVSFSFGIRLKKKNKKRCSDYLPKVTYPDMTQYYFYTPVSDHTISRGGVIQYTDEKYIPYGTGYSYGKWQPIDPSLISK